MCEKEEGGWVIRNRITTKMINSFVKVLGWACVVLCIASYVVPQLALFSHGLMFRRVGWDDTTYLSYQGVLGTMYWPGFYLQWVTYGLQLLGLTGAEIGVLYTFLLVPLIVWLLYKTLDLCNYAQQFIPFYVVLIAFGAVLVNMSNPVIHTLVAGKPLLFFLVHGYGSQQPILRAPNPLLGYFVIALCVYLYANFRKTYILFIPLFLLYYPVFVVYVYFLFYFLAKNYLKKEGILWGLLYLVFSYLVLVAVIGVLFGFFVDPSIKKTLSLDAFNYVDIRKFFLPVTSFFGFFLLFVSIVFNKFTINIWHKRLLFLSLGVVFLSNVNLLLGYSISEMKDVQDWGVGALAGLMVVFFLESFCVSIIKWFFVFIVLGYVLHLTLLSEGYFSHYHRFHFTSGYSFMSEQDRKRINNDPLHAIVFPWRSASQVAYTTPFGLHPISSYVYNFSIISNQCGVFLQAMEGAVEYLKSGKYSPDLKQYVKKNKVIKYLEGNLSKVRVNRRFRKNKDLPYCSTLKTKGPYFIIVAPKRMVYHFP